MNDLDNRIARENLIADCDVVLCRLRGEDPEAPWSNLTHASVEPRVRTGLEKLAAAARIEAADPLPEPPRLLFSLTTREGLALAASYVQKLCRWAVSLLPAPPAKRTGRPRQGESDKELLVLGALVGRLHAEQVAGSLHGVAASAKELPTHYVGQVVAAGGSTPRWPVRPRPCSGPERRDGR